MKYYACDTCGNVVEVIRDSAIIPLCCGTSMRLIIPNNNEVGSLEKHIPVYKQYGNKIVVQVGDVLHPMSEEHYIKWIALETDKGVKIQYLKPDDKPTACFCLTCNEKFIAAYAYCNLHGLWKVDNMKSKANQTDYKDWPDYINI